MVYHLKVVSATSCDHVHLVPVNARLSDSLAAMHVATLAFPDSHHVACAFRQTTLDWLESHQHVCCGRVDPLLYCSTICHDLRDSHGLGG